VGNVLTLAASKPATRSSGPTIFAVLLNEEGKPYGPVSDDEYGYQLVQSPSGEPYMVSADHKVLSGRAPLDAVNARNVERYRIDVATRAIDAALKGDDDAQNHALSLAALIDAEDDDDAQRAAVTLAALDSLDDEQRVSALAQQRDALSKARKGLPSIDAARTTRVASGLALYEEEGA